MYNDINEFRTRINTLKDISTSDEIAEFFKGEGIRGDKSSAYSCPISNYVKTGINGDGTVTTGVMYVHLEQIFFDTREELTDAMTCFVDNFDSGQYPFLEWPGE